MRRDPDYTLIPPVVRRWIREHRPPTGVRWRGIAILIVAAIGVLGWTTGRFSLAPDRSDTRPDDRAIPVDAVREAVPEQKRADQTRADQTRADQKRTADGGQWVSVHFTGTTRGATATSLLRKRGFTEMESSYDTVWASAGLIVPPTEKQVEQLRSEPDVWAVRYEGDPLRKASRSVPAEKEKRLERLRQQGALCPTNRIRVSFVPTLPESGARKRLERLPTAKIRFVRKPANDVRVKVDEASDLRALRSLTDHTAVRFLAHVQR